MADRIAKIKSVSRLFRRIFQILTWAIPVFVVGFWISANYIHEYVKIPLFAVPLYPLSLGTQIAAMAITMIVAACLIFLCVELGKLFLLYEKGNIFTLDNSRCLKRAAIAVLAYVPLSMMVVTLLKLLFTMNQTLQFEITFSSSELGYLLLGGMMMVVSWVMAEAGLLKNDNDLTI